MKTIKKEAVAALLFILFGIIFNNLAQVCGTCSAANCAITNNTTATDGSNITAFDDCYTLPTPATSGTISTCYTISTDGSGKIGFRLSEAIRQDQNSASPCNSTAMDAIDNSRSYSLKLASAGCGGIAITPDATNVNNSLSGFNPEWYSLQANTSYVLCTSVTIPNAGCQFEEICMVGYHLPTNTINCTASIGTVAVTGATANGNEWDLSDGQTVTLTASNYTLPPTDGGTGTCVKTYGYFIFDQAPTLPINDISTIPNIPGFKGPSSGITCDDNNASGFSGTISSASKLWFVPFVADCKKLSSDNKLHLDEDLDNCYAIGTTAIIVNYITNPPVVTATCTSCSNATCPIISSTGSTVSDARTAATNDMTNSATSNEITTNLNTGDSKTICVPITVSSNSTLLGLKHAFRTIAPNVTCFLSDPDITRNYQLTSSCGTTIAPKTANGGGVSSNFNPEWDVVSSSPTSGQITPGNYTFCITISLSASAIDCSLLDKLLLDEYQVQPACSTPSAPTCGGTTICSGSTTSLTASGVSGNTFKWYDAATNGTIVYTGASFTTPVLTTAKSYWVTQSNGACESARTRVDVTVNQKTLPIFTQIGPLCATGTIPTLQTTSTNNIAGTWNPATINTSVGSHHYIFSATANQCAADTVMDIVITNNITPSFTQIGPLCATGTIPAIPTTSSNNITGSWNPSTISSANTHYVFTADANQCASNTSMDIVVTNSIQPTFTQIGPLCKSATIPALPTTSTNNITGTWNPTNIITTPGTNNYIFTADPNQCAGNTNMNITINPIVRPNFTQINPFCESEPNIPTLPTSSPNNISGSWNPSLVGTSIGATVYNFTASPNQCTVDTTMTITVNSAPIVSFTVDKTSGCVPLDVIFTNTTTNSTSTQWSFGNSTSSNSTTTAPVTYSTSGCFDVTLTVNSNGCSTTKTINQLVCADAKPVAQFIMTPNTITTENSVAKFYNTSSNANTYIWSFGDGGSSTLTNPDHAFDPTNLAGYTISLIAISSSGCSDTLVTTLSVSENLMYYVPNSFTPDGNAFNNLFKPIFNDEISTENYSLYIFNRWGELVFETHDKNQGWDGTYKNKKICELGTYTWKLEMSQKSNDNKVLINGHVNLLK